MVRDNDSIPKVRSRYGAVVLRKNRSRLDSNPRPYDAARNATIALTTAPQLVQALQSLHLFSLLLSFIIPFPFLLAVNDKTY